MALSTAGQTHAQPPSEESKQADAGQSAAESERLAARGFEAYKAGDYERALHFYNQALEVHPAAALYFNVARIFETKLSAPEKAIEYYKKALQAPDVTEALEEKSLARIRVLTALTAQAKPPEEQEPPPEEAKEPEREPEPVEREPRAAAPEKPATSARSTQRTIGYAVGITGLVAAGAGLGLGGFALLERDKARETCDGNRCTTKGGVDSMNTAYDLATASTITVAAGGALLAVGLGMVLFAPKRKSADQDSAKAQPRAGRRSLELAIQPASAGTGLELAGVFF